MYADGEDDEPMNANRKLNVYKHIKKKAANDAQLLMNRIALIQKEEERARKKIDQTKERAVEILAMRKDHQHRVKAYAAATEEAQKLQKVMRSKNKEHDSEGKAARRERLEATKVKKREEVGEMLMEKKYLTQLMIQEQEAEIQKKQQKREEIRKMEEAIKRRKELERQEKERKVKEFYEQKIKEEAEEARRAEKLVKALEKREREWIEKLRQAQLMQETAFEQLEGALLADESANKTAASSSPGAAFDDNGGNPGDSTSGGGADAGRTPAVKPAKKASPGGTGSQKKAPAKKAGGH